MRWKKSCHHSYGLGKGSKRHKAYSSRDTVAAKCMPRRVQHCTYIVSSRPFSSGPHMLLGPQSKDQAAITVRVPVPRDGGLYGLGSSLALSALEMLPQINIEERNDSAEEK